MSITVLDGNGDPATLDPPTQTTLAALLASIGAATDAAVSTNADGTVNAHMRGALVELIALLATTGATNGAAVVTDANGTLQQYLRGLVKLWIAGLPAGTASIGTVQPGNTANTTPWLVSLQPATGGGSSIYRNLDAGSTGAVAKNGAGQLYGYYIYNNATSARFLKIYDKATAPTSGDTPVMTYPIPAGSAANVAFPNGVAFANGISVRATTGVADADTGAPSTNDVVINLNYK